MTENEHYKTGKLGTYKSRCGFGQWHTIIAFACEHCNNTIRQVINYHGPTPPGAYLCPYCNQPVKIR